MSDDKTPMQADGGKAGAPPTPQGHKADGAGESGGGAYKHDHSTTGDNREIDRPVETGREPKE